MSFGGWGFGGGAGGFGGGGFGAGAGGGARGYGLPTRFEEQYHCYSVAYADKAHLEGGDKILLPPSAFDTLARLQVDYPMLFQLQSSQRGTMTHCGVLEFTAEEGSCYIPFWMMQNLLIEEGSVLSVTNISLPKATFVKLQPQNLDFLEITNPRAVLEHALRKYSCVTAGDTILVPYNDKNYHFRIQQVKPQDAACIIETDCNVDFDAPVGYKEHTQLTNTEPSTTPIPKQSAYANKNDDNDTTFEDSYDKDKSEKKASGLQIVNGEILRSDETGDDQLTKTTMLAPKTGRTGVQRNSVIPETAPEIDYWALKAGDGARLDGKKTAPLKSKEGHVLDVRALRAEAAAKRLAATTSSVTMPEKGMTLKGASVSTNSTEKPKTAASQRKSRIGTKYSKLKPACGFAFEGSSN